MDKKLFRKQVESLIPDLKKFSLSLTHDKDNCNDLVQQSIITAFSKADQFRGNSNLKSWIFRIVYTTWIDITRKNRTIVKYENMIQKTQLGNDRNRSTISSLNTCIDCKNLFKHLPDKQKASFHLVCVEGYTYSEAAKILGVPVGTVASRVSHIRLKFNQYFSERERSEKIKKRKLS